MSRTLERPDVRDYGAGNLMPDNKDSRESAPSTTHDTQLTQTTRHPKREKRPPKHLDEYVTDIDEGQCMSLITFVECHHFFSHIKAICSAESMNWKKAMSEEIDSLRENETFTLTTLSEGRKSVGVSGCSLLRNILMVRSHTKQYM